MAEDDDFVEIREITMIPRNGDRPQNLGHAVEALPGLARVVILFPDPWPKTRHHKRRFLQMGMLDELARVLKPGAELRFATDDKSYLPYALERLLAHPGFEWLAKSPQDWQSRPADWPPTRYETKAIKGPPTFLRFARR